MPSPSATKRPWVPKIDPQALALAMARKGYTQPALIRKCQELGVKVSSGNLHRTLHGKPGALGTSKLPAIAEALEVDVAELLTAFGKTVASENAGQPT